MTPNMHMQLTSKYTENNNESLYLLGITERTIRKNKSNGTTKNRIKSTNQAVI